MLGKSWKSAPNLEKKTLKKISRDHEYPKDMNESPWPGGVIIERFGAQKKKKVPPDPELKV